MSRAYSDRRLLGAVMIGVAFGVAIGWGVVLGLAALEGVAVPLNAGLALLLCVGVGGASTVIGVALTVVVLRPWWSPGP